MIYRHKGQCKSFIGDDEVIVNYEAFHQEAKITGPWEDCYPEDSDMSITSITMDGEEVPDNSGDLDAIEQDCWNNFWDNVSAKEEQEDERRTT